jgi:subtilisin-like proprotein convertase family protein
MRAPAVENVSDTINVPDGFPLGEMTVTLDVSHRRIGALVVTLTAQPPASTGVAGVNRTVILKERGLGRLGDNMYMTSFADASDQSFPVPAVRYLTLKSKLRY